MDSVIAEYLIDEEDEEDEEFIEIDAHYAGEEGDEEEFQDMYLR